LSIIHREKIIALAVQHKLPTVCFQRTFVTGGGLWQPAGADITAETQYSGFWPRLASTP